MLCMPLNFNQSKWNASFKFKPHNVYAECLVHNLPEWFGICADCAIFMIACKRKRQRERENELISSHIIWNWKEEKKKHPTPNLKLKQTAHCTFPINVRFHVSWKEFERINLVVHILWCQAKRMKNERNTHICPIIHVCGLNACCQQSIFTGVSQP